MKEISIKTNGHPEQVEGSAQSVAAVYDRRSSDFAKFIGGHRPSLQWKKRILITALFGLIVPPGVSAWAQTAPEDSVGQLAKVTLHIGKASLTTEVAASEAQEERGLMFRTKLGDNDGMIFILPTVQTAEFWMKNTLIPLSVAFIDKNGVILEIHDMQPGDPNVPDAQLPRTRSDSDKVAYALETNLHWFALNGIKPGDKLQPAPGTLGPYLP